MRRKKPSVLPKAAPRRNWKVVVTCQRPEGEEWQFVRGRLYAADAWRAFWGLRKYAGVVRLEVSGAGRIRFLWRRPEAE